MHSIIGASITYRLAFCPSAGKNVANSSYTLSIEIIFTRRILEMGNATSNYCQGVGMFVGHHLQTL